MPQHLDKPLRIDRKQRLSIYLDPDLSHRLADHAVRREQSRSMIAEAAIASFLSPDADERRQAALAKRLDQIDRNNGWSATSASPTRRSPSSFASG